MKFEFSTAQRIIFGPDKIQELIQILPEFGRKILLIAGFDAWDTSPVPEILNHSQTDWHAYRVDREPTIDMIDEGASLARDFNAEVIIGFGGGSAMDTAKAVAAMATNPGKLLDYLEVIGAGRPLQSSLLPVIAIPTTAGTGAEVARNAVLESPEHRVKVSLRSNAMIPTVAIVDPKLTLTVPQSITAASGLDALTQVIEPFVSISANPLTDAICLEALRMAAWALPEVYLNGRDLAARTAMAFVSLAGGIALTNARLGAVHGFAGPFGGMYHAPHGAVCGRLLPAVMRANIRAVRDQPDHEWALRRYQQVASILLGDASADAEDGADWAAEMVETFTIPRLGSYGLLPDEFGDLVDKAQAASSMKGNPIRLSNDDCLEILETSV